MSEYFSEVKALIVKVLEQMKHNKLCRPAVLRDLKKLKYEITELLTPFFFFFPKKSAPGEWQTAKPVGKPVD